MKQQHRLFIMANFERILQRLVSSGADGGKVRKQLTKGLSVNFHRNGESFTIIPAAEHLAMFTKDGITLTSTQFVPWDETDAMYEEKLSDGTLFHDEDFIEIYFARFQDN